MSLALMVLAPKGSLENVSEVDLDRCINMISWCDGRAFKGQKTEVPFETFSGEYDGHVVYLHDETHHTEQVFVVVLVPELLRLPDDELPPALEEELRNIRVLLNSNVAKMYVVGHEGVVVDYEGGLPYMEGVISRLRQGRLSEV